MFSNINALDQLIKAVASLLCGAGCALLWRALSFKMPLPARAALDALLLVVSTSIYLAVIQFFFEGRLEPFSIILFILSALVSNTGFKKLFGTIGYKLKELKKARDKALIEKQTASKETAFRKIRL